MPEHLDEMPFQIDHIIAVKHHGSTIPGNLALSCYNCNAHKGPNVAGFDPRTGGLSRMFHPREDDWHEHSQ